MKNMGTADRAIRLMVAILIAILYFTGTITGTAALVLGFVAVIFAATSMVSFCPLYPLLGINTCKNK
ncbi:YgaP family membrane protein [Flavobacterium lotistagni]|uniref:YgaP family membrane protein n=1 Tax=Flavobacterium lotistagni TaxID=2709660 RepID=UPI00293BBD73|nr:DUF2892 domain-containing protein [Flavobacterium lotistagni]